MIEKRRKDPSRDRKTGDCVYEGKEQVKEEKVVNFSNATTCLLRPKT